MENIKLKYEKLQNELHNVVSLKEYLTYNKNVDIQNAIREINEKYALEEKRVDSKVEEAESEFLNFRRNIIMYSSFDHELIGNAMAYLISIFDGLDYVYESGKHIVLFTNYAPMGVRYTDKKTNELKMLIKKELKDPQSKYEDLDLGENIIERYAQEKNAIVLEDHFFPFIKSKITFYKRIDDNQLVLSVDFNGFTYLEDFINYVIEYRYNNNLKDFSNDDMNKLIVSFVNMNKDEINARHFEKLNKQIKIR